MASFLANLQNVLALGPRAYPLLGEALAAAPFAHVPLSPGAPGLADFDVLSYEGLALYMAHCLAKAKARYGYGGYAEPRRIYEASPYFDGRSVHLGLDLWAAAGTPVHAPLPGWVHSVAYNAQPRDYGGTIILAHELGGLRFHTLYGHLSLASLEGKTVGQPLALGEPFAALGVRGENGGWVPHLHVQIIGDMQGREGDYPGVAAPAEAAAFLSNCPDPRLILPFLPSA